MVTRFCLAGFAFEVQGPAALVERLRSAWSAFVAPSAVEARIRICVEVEGPAHPEPVVQLPIPALDPAGERAWTLSAEAFRAHVRADGDVRVVGPDALFPVDVVVRVLLGQDLARRGGLLIHGVGVALGGEGGAGALFTGDSGAGKSTLGRCAVEGGLVRLSDELVAVVPRDGGSGYGLCGTPWNIGSARSSALEQMGLLAHGKPGEPDFIEALPPTEVMRVLLSNVLVAEASAAERARVVRNATAVLNAVPTVRLHFAPTAAVASVLREALAPAG